MFNSPLDAIGNTPLIKLSIERPASLYAKLEYLNPGGSVKDRSALFMIEHAEKKGLLKPGGTIIDASSGNHGVAVAMIGALKGYPVIITVSEKISSEKLKTIKAYGARVVVCPATAFIDDPRSYHSVARALVSQTPGSFMPDQYFNPLNAHAHYHMLSPEIWRQTAGRITHFFAAAGTGGTVSGVGRFLKEKNKNIRVIALDAQNSFYSTGGNPQPYKIEGMGIDFISPVMDYALADEIIPVADECALGMLKQLPKKYGILAGMSSGAVAYGAFCYAQQLSDDALAVMIFGDSGRAYLSKELFDE